MILNTFSLAYIDPGAGAMLLQWIAAAALGTLLLFGRTILAFFGIWRKKRPAEEDSQTAPASTDEGDKTAPGPNERADGQ